MIMNMDMDMSINDNEYGYGYEYKGLGCRGIGLGVAGVVLIQLVMGAWDVGVLVAGFGWELVAGFGIGLCFGSVPFALTASAEAGSVSAK